MQIVAIMLMFLAVIGGTATRNIVSAPNEDHLKAQVMARNMVYYSEKVNAYVHLHPTYSGTVPDSSLAFDPWYNNIGSWTNIVNGAGLVYIFSSNLADLRVNRIDTELATATNYSLNTGYSDGGTFRNSKNGANTLIVLPAAIPNQSPVIFSKNN